MAGLPGSPVLDVSSVAGGAPAGLDRLAREIGAACRDIGFFSVTDHDVPPALIGRTFAMTRAFFALPIAVKMAVAMANSPHNRGYMPFEGETLDPDRPGDLKETFGDCPMRRTNDICVPTPHRARIPRRERDAIAVFLEPDPDADVSVRPGCVSAARPARYPPTTGAASLKERLDATQAFRRAP